MSTLAAVMTGKGIGAISTIRLYGDSARTIVRKIFKPSDSRPAVFKTGTILMGTIHDDDRIIDLVTVACEQPDTLAVNCHGNPLIVAGVMQLLQKNAVVLVSPEELLTEMFTAQKNLNTIEIEAKLAQLKAETLRAARIIANQIDAGLNKTATGWLQNIDATALSQIHSEARLILEKSRTARPLLFGCRAAITGPPNTGKSTLLNCLAGRQKAIVTDIKGTTRDWLSAHCRIGPLAVELIDTAGLDERLAETPDNIIEKTSQQRSIEILQQADIVLLVLDNSEPMQQLDDRLIEAISGKKVVTILNKCDRPAMFDVGRLPECLTDTVQISAKESTGIDTLCVEIERIFGVTGFDPKTPICFTDRQKTLLQQLIKTDSAQRAASIISELLNGQMQGGPCYSAK